MRVAIVGGSGNMSAPVVRRLLEKGHEVICITRGKSQLPDGANAMTGDRNDLGWFIPAVKQAKFDAAIDFVAFTLEHGQASLEAFRDVGHFVHISTVSTYGEAFEWLPVTEDHPDLATHAYGQRKSAIERFYKAEHLTSGFPVTIMKPSTTYGRQRVVRQLGIDTRWLTRIRQGRPILKVGEGNATHHLLHVDDAAIGLVGVLGRARCIGQTYQLVHPRHVTWLDVHSAAMEVIGRQVEQVPIAADTLYATNPQQFMFVPGPFSKNNLFSAAKLQRDVPEFQPKVSIHEGIADALEYLERRGLLEQVPEGDWEDEMIAIQLAAARRIAEVKV